MVVHGRKLKTATRAVTGENLVHAHAIPKRKYESEEQGKRLAGVGVSLLRTSRRRDRPQLAGRHRWHALTISELSCYSQIASSAGHCFANQFAASVGAGDSFNCWRIDRAL
jgi:hypothetical protein